MVFLKLGKLIAKGKYFTVAMAVKFPVPKSKQFIAAQGAKRLSKADLKLKRYNVHHRIPRLFVEYETIFLLVSDEVETRIQYCKIRSEFLQFGPLRPYLTMVQ